MSHWRFDPDKTVLYTWLDFAYCEAHGWKFFIDKEEKARRHAHT